LADNSDRADVSSLAQTALVASSESGYRMATEDFAAIAVRSAVKSLARLVQMKNGGTRRHEGQLLTPIPDPRTAT
jgi:hypothetical protein